MFSMIETFYDKAKRVIVLKDKGSIFHVPNEPEPFRKEIEI